MRKISQKRPDIYIGLVGAAGTDLDPVKSQLRAQFAAIDYLYEEVKVSSLIASFFELDTSKFDEAERIETLMDKGDAIRKAADSGDGVISLIINDIRKKRNSDPVADDKSEGFKGSTLFLIDSLKNPKEIEALDSAYARNYYTISVYAEPDERKKRLAKKIAQSRNEVMSEHHSTLALNLMKQDEGRKPPMLSQDVLKTFPRAEFFIKSDDDVAGQLKRFVELIFGSPFITPTPDEYMMNMARTASLRSCDLSRQVGAIIVDKEGGIISQGYNEVPYPGGGTYYEGRPNAKDNRDYTKSEDPNQTEILEVVKDLIKILREDGAMASSNSSIDQFSYDLLYGTKSSSTADSRIKSLIEFGRVVHAEMHAICEAAKLGRAVKGATLYCTAFPCHICARHVIAAGINEVVFVEPYPKSLVTTLYQDEISTESSKVTLPGAVVFRPFQGVSPILFRRVFNMKPRKNKDGSAIKWESRNSKPLRAVERVLHYKRECVLVDRLPDIKQKLGLSKPVPSPATVPNISQ